MNTRTILILAGLGIFGFFLWGRWFENKANLDLNTVIGTGSTGDSVTYLQRLLTNQGYTTQETGQMNTETINNLDAFLSNYFGSIHPITQQWTLNQNITLAQIIDNL